MTDVVYFDIASFELESRTYTAEEMAAIAASQPTANDLINQQIAALRATITDDIRDRAVLGDTADLKAIYDAINALKSQLV